MIQHVFVEYATTLAPNRVIRNTHTIDGVTESEALLMIRTAYEADGYVVYTVKIVHPVRA